MASVVGVGGSPSCGVHTTLDLTEAMAAIARRPRAPVTAAWLNETVVDPALRPGRGLFIQVLTEELSRRRLTVPVGEHNLPTRGR